MWFIRNIIFIVSCIVKKGPYYSIKEEKGHHILSESTVNSSFETGAFADIANTVEILAVQPMNNRNFSLSYLATRFIRSKTVKERFFYMKM